MDQYATIARPCSDQGSSKYVYKHFGYFFPAVKMFMQITLQAS